MPECLESASYHAWLSGQEGYKGQISFHGFFPPREGDEGVGYRGRYSEMLKALKLAPYHHQLEALTAVEAGENVVVATPTASGKSLCYQLPTLAALRAGKTALYLFPTKALAQDQLEKLQSLAEKLDLAALIATYDGDTASTRRRALRESANCLLTNPDMLHYGILPHHGQWAAFLGRLEFIVVDELHSYRGVMGTHVANILRRLLRLSRHYGAAPRVITASATIGNPAEHARNLTGLPFTAIREDFAPQAAKEFVFWRPPDISLEEGRRRSVNGEAAELAALFVKRGLKSIFFCNSRKSAELLRRYAAGQLSEEEAERICSYRAGYTPEDRRELEAAFKRGDISVLSVTSALELGMDVGGVDAVVLVGYPGSMTALWQRAGRAGRGDKRALTLLIPGNDPLDEYYLTHPEVILESRAENAVADAFNREIHPLHLACAAYELPLAEDEEMVGGVDLGVLPGLVKVKASSRVDPPRPPLKRGEMAQSQPPFLRGAAERSASRGDASVRWRYRGRYPHGKISVRGLGAGRIVLKDGAGRQLGSSDFASALRELHPGAVYLHQGETYLVRNLDLEKGVAVLLPQLEAYYTQARSTTDIEILEHEAMLSGVNVGRVRVSTEVTSYVRKRYFSEAILDERPLDLPELAYNTQALWFSVSHVAYAVPPSLLPSAIHALEHTLIGLLPVFVLCERADVGGVSYPFYPASGEPTIFIYDGYPGGVGYTLAGASVFSDWLRAARDLLKNCPCKHGCPRCVLSPKCGNGNQSLDKGAALALAEHLLKITRSASTSLTP